MRGEHDLATLLAPWAQASARVEQNPGPNCLTAEEITTFLETPRRGASREARARASDHLATCSFCSHEVATLFRAREAREERLRVRQTLGERATRVAACLRVLVEEARGAFTRPDGLLAGIGMPMRLTPSLAVATGPARGEEDGEEADPDRLHEVMLTSAGLPSVEVFLAEEEGDGAVTVAISEPWEVQLVAPDGGSEPVLLEAGGDRYYGTVTGLGPGGYYLTFFRPESRPASRPGA